MYNAFYGCNNLVSVKLKDKWLLYSIENTRTGNHSYISALLDGAILCGWEQFWIVKGRYGKWHKVEKHIRVIVPEDILKLWCWIISLKMILIIIIIWRNFILKTKRS